MPPRRVLTFVPADPQAFYDRYLMADVDEPELTLAELLRDHPALCLGELDQDYLPLKVSSLMIKVEEPAAGTPLYLPPGTSLLSLGRSARTDDAGEAGQAGQAGVSAQAASEPGEGTGQGAQDQVSPGQAGHPSKLSDRQAVLVAHAGEIEQAASYLDGGLSVLIRCEKLLVEHLAGEIATRSGRPAHEIQAVAAGGPGGSDLMGLGGGGRRAELIAALQRTIAEAGAGDVIVVPHLDLLAGGTDATLSGEARELTDLLYERSERVILAFTDPSLVIPEVLANRFAVRLGIEILPRAARAADGNAVPIGRALVTESEAALFDGFDPVTLYKHVAGMNAVRLRHGLRFAYHQHAHRSAGQATFAELLQELRGFKARTSSAFEVPNVPLEAIGGYEDVKAELARALRIISGAAADDRRLSDRMRHELVPRGFIFHGPPGTGKTLFAKAIASSLDATILVVSGPEITDMYVGESERKLRDLFTEARRNAPAVLVFDEFDSIAGRRTGRDDGGSRAGNAIVAQLLTELDGFRPEVPVLIIGTTNRMDIIDDALLRPSRFRPIKIDLPNEQARKAIAEVHARNFEVECSDALLTAIAAATEGMNGDEIRSIFRDARADELVGGERQPDARRLGELIGSLRMAAQQREIDRAHPFGRPVSGPEGRPGSAPGRRFAILADSRASTAPGQPGQEGQPGQPALPGQEGQPGQQGQPGTAAAGIADHRHPEEGAVIS
ncbi:MAG TPA: ATP-binding protein [Streptosporangiaceae bacterium]|nr:ATP-binding protein [Streptosporangiaceae bacterium]